MTASHDRLGYVHSRLVRHAAERDGADAPSAEAPDAAHVRLAGDRVVVRLGEGATALLDHGEAARGGEPGVVVFLGRVDGRPVFAAALPAEAEEAFPEPGHRVVDLRGLANAGLVAPDELGLLATAKSVLAWHARQRFCANCGTETVIAAGGFRRECPGCGAHHFPRTDPVVIMLVVRGTACLLGRGAHFPETMFSCLAGFVEPGETLEDAVRRETVEESGIRVGAVRYHASQPWPFPSSLMIGCRAEAISETLAVDPVELADARWFDRAEIASMMEGRHPDGLTLPPATAIAHMLLRDFLDGAL